MIHIPGFNDLQPKFIVCDYNGTIARDGIVERGVQSLFDKLAQEYRIFVVTADTFGSVKTQLQGFACEVKILTSSDHTAEKAAFVRELGASQCVAIGNGNNDAKMLETALLGIAVMGAEGCSKEAMLASDLLIPSATEALELLHRPKRLIATLRR